jgi:hypothetical protein
MVDTGWEIMTCGNSKRVLKSKNIFIKSKKAFLMVAGAKYFLKWAISYLSYNLSAPMFMCFFLPALCWHITNSGTVFLNFFTNEVLLKKEKEFLSS